MGRQDFTRLGEQQVAARGIERVVEQHCAGREHGGLLGPDAAKGKCHGGGLAAQLRHGRTRWPAPMRRFWGLLIMKFYLGASLAALALLVGALPAAAQNVEFTLINASSHSLHYFYTNPSNSDAWGEDLLGETGTLESGEQGTVLIGDGS